MSNSLKSLFEKIKIDAQTADISYVYYDKKSGEIHKISPRKEDSNYEILELDHKEVKDLLTGEKKTADYKVSYDIGTKLVILKNIHEGNTVFLYDKVLYKIPKEDLEISDSEIPKEDLEISDLIIKQDFITNTWKVSISNETIQFIRSNNLSSHDKILLSVTKKDDPNILYRTLYIELGNAIENSIIIPFQFDFEFEQREVSIYTNKYFKSYSYKVTQ